MVAFTLPAPGRQADITFIISSSEGHIGWQVHFLEKPLSLPPLFGDPWLNYALSEPTLHAFHGLSYILYLPHPSLVPRCLGS